MEQVAIIGVGTTQFRPAIPELSWKELMFEAAIRAYADAEIDPRTDVSSFITCAEDYWEGFSIFDEFVPDQLGAVQRPTHTVCGDGLLGIANACMQIQTGLFDIVVVEAHSKISDLLTLEDVIRFSQDPVFEAPLGGHPLYVAGLEMREYLKSSAVTEEQCARIVVQNKRNALRNPMACYAGELTTEDVLGSPPCFDPIKELDIAPTADGAVVLVLANDDVAKQMDHPVFITGIGWSSDAPWIGDRGAEAIYARDAARRAYQMANITRPNKELDLFEVDDQFSYKELQHLEALGVVDGQPMGKLLEDGVLAPDGHLPTNVSGGSLGIGNAFEANGLLKVAGVVQQLRGEAGRLQVEKAKTGLVQSWRGVPHGTGAVAIFERKD